MDHMECPLPPKRAKKTLGDLLNELDDSDGEGVAEESGLEKEINLYSTLPRVKNSNACPLDWWRRHQSTFPTLALFAKKFLCIPATSVPYERTFSAPGNIVTIRRNCLKPDKVNQLCFLAANLE